MSTRRLVALWLASFALFFSFFLLLSTLPLFLRRLGASDGAIGVAMAGAGLALARPRTRAVSAA